MTLSVDPVGSAAIHLTLDGYVNAELLRLSVKYDCKPPEVVWTKGMPPAMMMWYMDLSTMWEEAFRKDPFRTLPMLSYATTHEFRHWMTIAKHFPIPLPRGPKWREKRTQYQEMAAHEFAQQETNISRAEFWSWWDTLFPGRR